MIDIILFSIKSLDQVHYIHNITADVMGTIRGQIFRTSHLWNIIKSKNLKDTNIQIDFIVDFLEENQDYYDFLI